MSRYVTKQIITAPAALVFQANQVCSGYAQLNLQNCDASEIIRVSISHRAVMLIKLVINLTLNKLLKILISKV